MKLFKTNQNIPERVLRFILAIFLIPAPFALEQSNYTYLICVLGFILLFNAIIGTCFIYKIIGVDTCKVRD
tara:strand:+ start:380 stop:592 length:213 start_codon:yes stop_codon:yes gene_type:complete